MLLQMFSIYDVKAELYHQPMFLRTQGEAIRAFMDEANNSQSQIYKHPEDYVLYHVGQFDNATGLVEPENALIGKAIELIDFSKAANHLPDAPTPLEQAINTKGA